MFHTCLYVKSRKKDNNDIVRYLSDSCEFLFSLIFTRVDSMVNAIYLAYFLIAILNTWFLVQQIKTRKTLTISHESSALLKETNINIGLSVSIYLVDIMFVYMTNAIH